MGFTYLNQLLSPFMTVTNYLKVDLFVIMGSNVYFKPTEKGYGAPHYIGL